MSLFDFFFPKKCVGCKKAGSYFCSTCVGKARPQFPQVCPVCERPSLDGVRHRYCYKPFSPEGLTSVWVYEGVIRKVIAKLKYRFISSISEDLIEAVQVHTKVLPSTKEGIVWSQKGQIIVPIPLYWMRKNWRGFNHSEELAKVLSKEMSWKVVNLLIRTQKAKSQVGLKEKERIKNIEGVFEINRQVKSLPKSVILFDDVWTTGSTMLEATKILKKAGVKRVWCLTLAR